MKYFMERIPWPWRLALAIGLLLLLLPVVFLYLCRSPRSADAAFSRAVEDAACEPAELELLLPEIEDDYRDSKSLGIGAGENWACQTWLRKDEHGAWSSEIVRSYPAVEEGLWCVPVDWISRSLDNRYEIMRDDNGEGFFPCIAVKCPGATASARLVLEEGYVLELYTNDERYVYIPDEQYQLVLDRAENGWFLFRYDYPDIERHFRVQQTANGTYDVLDGRYEPLQCWIRARGYDEKYCPHAHLELTVWDENGLELRHTRIPLT